MLQGTKVLLRAAIEDDYQKLLSIRNDVELQMQLMSLPRANTVQRVRDWVARVSSDAETLFFIVADSETNKAVGFIQLNNMNFLHGVAELGICIVSEAQGLGYAQEALLLTSNYASEVFRIRKIVLKVLAANQRAATFYEKMNFVRVGIHKEHFYQRQQFHDVLVMERFTS